MPLPPPQTRLPRPDKVVHNPDLGAARPGPDQAVLPPGYQRAPDQREVPPLLHELSPEQWNLWRHHPITELLLTRYLPDFRRGLERQTINGWMAGLLSLANEQEARGYLLTAHMIENLSLEHLRVFYGMAPPLRPVRAGRTA